ncbi:serine hydrolase [Patescibacteria group bacterium]
MVSRFDYSYSKKQKKSVNKSIAVIAFIIVITIFIYAKSRTSNVISPLPDKYQVKFNNEIITTASPINPEELKKTIAKIANAQWNNYSILIVDLNNDFEVDIGGNIIYDAASVNKIPILAALYSEVNSGNIDLNKSITLKAKNIQDYGTGSIRYDPPGSTYSIKTLARLMMVESDNTAAYILANLVLKQKDIQFFVENWGMTQTDMIKNTTSNRDIAILMKKIYQGEITNPSYTKEMLEFMTDSLFEDRIPALLPPEVKVYHKIGNGTKLYHDAGVVETKNTVYYIGIFTSDVPDEKSTFETEAKISKTVYDFLNK